MWNVIMPRGFSEVVSAMKRKRVRADKRLSVKDHIIVHCSATKVGQDFDASDIDRMHKARGWSGNGYHVVIPRAGEPQTAEKGYPCRKLHAPAAAVGDCGPGWNTRSINIVLIGGIDEKGRPQDNFTARQKEQLAAEIRRLHIIHPEPWRLVVMGHRDLIRKTNAPPKACPCFDVIDFLEDNAVLAGFDFQGDIEPGAKGSDLMELPEEYIIETGDTYWSIAKKFGLSAEYIRERNTTPSRDLRPGQVIRIR